MKRDFIALAFLILSTSSCISSTSIWFYDGDADGFGDPDLGKSIIAQQQPLHYVKNDTDCDDNDASNFPGNVEVEDGLDNNCNGFIDEGFFEPAHTVEAFPDLQHPLRLSVFIANAGDQSNRLFVVRKHGSIEVFDNSPSVTSGATFLDISSKVASSNPEEGMLGLAFHPNYSQNGYFYVYYTEGSTHSMILARYSASVADPNQADPSSEQIILEIPQDSISHKGGTVAFGPDGYLYLSVGDGSTTGDPYGHGQNTTSLPGSILRIDVDSASPYAIPADNPFANETGNNRKEIWAYGFRNPFRFSFDRLNGNLWAADVGLQNREEIDVVVNGGNYGWNIWEGTYQRKPGSTDGFIFPVYEYDHADVGGAAAIIGGHVYRGSAVPSLQGKYLYADYLQSGKISVLNIDHDNNFNVLSEEEIFLENNSGITAIGQDEAGELYVSVIVTGRIFKIVAGNNEPTGGGTEHCNDNTESDINWAASNADCPNLADYNLYADPANPLGATNGSGMPFDLNTPLFSDYAHKYRQLFIPPGEQIQYVDGQLVFPVGSILAKTFYYVDDERLIETQQTVDLMETRLLINRGTAGWASHAYVWNNGVATLALDGAEKPANWIDAEGVSQSLNYGIPDREQCEVCHTSIVEPLGPQVRHINREYDYGSVIENQINHWADAGILANAPDPTLEPRDPLWSDPTDGSLEDRARAYLDNNCAHCHNNSTGEAFYTNLWLSSDQATGPSTGVCVFQYGDLPGYSRIVVPGKPEESALIYRVASIDPGIMMPRLAKNIVHKEGLQLLSDWVASLTGDCP